MRSADKSQLFDAILRHSDRLGEFGVNRCGVFGSFVRDEATPASDVDILIGFRDGEETFLNFMGVADLLEEVLGRKVDLLTEESLSPYIGPHILREVEYVLGA